MKVKESLSGHVFLAIFYFSKCHMNTLLIGLRGVLCLPKVSPKAPKGRHRLKIYVDLLMFFVCLFICFCCCCCWFFFVFFFCFLFFVGRPTVRGARAKKHSPVNAIVIILRTSVKFDRTTGSCTLHRI